MLMLATTYVCGKLLTERGVGIGEIVFYRQLFAWPVAAACAAGDAGPQGDSDQPHRHARLALDPRHDRHAAQFRRGRAAPRSPSPTSIAFTMPIFATILSAIVLREHIGIHRWSAVILGFIGVVIMAHPDSEHLANIGVAIALAGAFVTAIISIVLRDLNKTEHAPTIVFWFTTISLPPLAILAPHRPRAARRPSMGPAGPARHFGRRGPNC